MKFGKKIVGDDGSEVFGYKRYLEYKCCFSEPLQCLKMPFLTQFEFKVFLTKRPEVYPKWDDPESDEEEVPSDVFFGMKVHVKIESIDSLKKSSKLLV